MVISKVTIPQKANVLPKFGAAQPQPERLRRYVRAEQDEFVRRVQEQDQERIERERKFQAKLAEEREVLQAVASAEAKEKAAKAEKANLIRQQSDETLIEDNACMAKLRKLALEVQSSGPELQQLSEIEEKIAKTQEPAKVLRAEGKKLPLRAMAPQLATELDGPYFDKYIMDMLKEVPAGMEQNSDFFKIKHHADGGFMVTMNINRGAELYLKMMKVGFEKDKHYPRIKEIQKRHVERLSPNTEFIVTVSERGKLGAAYHRYQGKNDVKTWNRMAPDFEYGQPFIGMMMHRTWLMNEFFTKVLPS